MAITQLHTACIKDGTIVNADIDSNAAIALGKLGTSGTAGSGNFLRGDGAWTAIDLTALNASNLTSGTVPDARFPSTLPAVSGANLTNVNASNLSSGTVAAARLDTATTQSAGNNSTKIATTAYADTAVSNLVDSAPGALNTLNELAAALGDDANFSTTITNSIATKLPLAGGTLTGALQINGVLTTNGTHNFLQGSSSSNSTITLKKSASGADSIDYLQCRNSSNTLIAKIEGSGNATFNATVTANAFSGSGASLTNVNATTLDSIDSGSFLRSDTSATFSGSMLTLSHAGASYPLHISGTDDAKMLIAGASNPYFEFREGSTTKAFFQWHSQGYVKIQNAEDSSSLRIKDTLDFSTDDSTWHTVWHAGNDGSGSGLDADTLDGLQASQFLRKDTDQTTTGDITIENADPKLIIKDSNNTGNNSQNSLQGVDSNGNQDWIIGNYSTTESTLFIKNNRNASTKFTAAVSGDTWEIYGNTGHFAPCSDNAVDLGTTSKRIRNIYTADLNLSNKGSSNDVDGTWGQYTIQEGEDDLFLLNRRNGKKYKFNLTEVN